MQRRLSVKKTILSSVIILIIFLVIFSGCATTSDTQQVEKSLVSSSPSIPDWYLSGNIAGYDTDTYIVGIGEGSTVEDAIASAQSMIGGQLKVSVESTVDSFRKETNIGGQMDFFETFSESSTITVQETLQGSRVIRQEQVNGTYYVYAALHIQSFLSQALLDLSELDRQAQNQLLEARGAISQGLVLVAMDHYREAYDTIVTYYTKRAYVEALAPTRTPPSPVRAAEIVAEIRGMVGAIQITVVDGNNQVSAVGTQLPEPIVFSVTYQSRTQGDIPVPQVPVTIRAQDRSVLGRYTTAKDGQISAKVQAIPTQGTSGNVIATIDLYAIMGEFASSVGRPEAMVYYEIAAPKEKVNIALALYDTERNRLTNLERSVGRDLGNLGFAIADGDITWMIEGTCTVVSQQELTSYQGTQYIVTVEMDLKLIDRRDGRTVGTILITGNGMSAKDYDEATLMASNRLRIDTKDLSSLVAYID